MPKLISFLLTILILGSASAQKTIHDPNAEVRNVKGFHAIEVSSGIDLYLSSGEEAVAVSAKDAEYRNHIKTVVDNGVLKISFDWKEKFMNFSGGKALKAYVSFKTLDKLTASGGSDVKVDGTIKSGSLALVISGGSDFYGKVDAGTLTVHQTGGSDMHISGSATSINIRAGGGSDFKGYDLVSDNCTINASGGSDINITVNKELTAEASGASDVYWKGTATVKEVKATGAGSVSHKS